VWPGFKMRPVFLKITEIQRDRSGLISEKSALFTQKNQHCSSEIVHRKIGAKI
jgi:hypothetical protein